MKPTIFIGSATEDLRVARAVRNHLDYDAHITVWERGFFELNKNTLTELVAKLPNYDFAVFVFTPLDQSKIRGERLSTIRGNVLFEYGLSVGIIGHDRTFFVIPRNQQFHIPSDLVGITPGTYDGENNRTEDAVGKVSDDIRKIISEKGVKRSRIEAVTSVLSEKVGQVEASVAGALSSVRQEIETALSGNISEATNLPKDVKKRIDDYVGNIKTSADINELIKKGKFSQAEKKAVATLRTHQDEKEIKAYIYILLKENTKTAVIKAYELLRRNEIKDLNGYKNVSLRLYETGNLEKAIEISAKALTLRNISKGVNNLKAIVQIKSNLAYFYADTGKQEYAETAKGFAKDGYEDDKERVSRLDTLGYVLIVFGNEKEVIRGMRLCQKAYELYVGSGKADGKFYQKHINKAVIRLNELHSATDS